MGDSSPCTTIWKREEAKLPVRVLILCIGLWYVGTYHIATAFNVDTNSPIVLVEPLNNDFSKSREPGYFGFSVATAQDSNDTWVLVGAPRSRGRSRNGVNVHPGGVVYRCLVTPSNASNSCHIYIASDNVPDSFGNGTGVSELLTDNDNWLGVSVATRRTAADFGTFTVMACGHRYRTSTAYVNTSVGLCVNTVMTSLHSKYPMNGPGDIGRENIVIPTREKFFLGTNSDLLMWGNTLTGTSLHVTEDGHTLIGLPGLLSRKCVGSAVSVDGSCISVFDREVPREDTYAGYSVTSLRSKSEDPVAGKEYLYVTGATRYNGTGKVIIFRNVSRSAKCNTTIELEIFGDQPFSYYGAAVCGVDVNGDGNDDLLVGAPYYNQKIGDEGIVFVYINDKGYFDQTSNMTLTGRHGVQHIGHDARFGLAIASINDINLDNYIDVAVGAPYDNDGGGAVYVYLGSSRGLIDHYAQRLTPVELGLHGNALMRNFGRFLTGRVDVDGNAYPDLVVGARDAVVILRSRPVHGVDVKVQFKDTVIRWHRPSTCSGLVDFNRFWNHPPGHHSDQQQQQQPLQQVVDVDDMRCPHSSDVGLLRGELSEQLSYETAFCSPFVVLFNYSTPDMEETHFNNGLKYRIRIDNYSNDVTDVTSSTRQEPRGFLIRQNHPCGPPARSVSADMWFAEDLLQLPLKPFPVDEWIIVFPRLPKNVVDPVDIRVEITGTIEESDASRSRHNGTDVPDFRALTPVLNPLISKYAHGTLTVYNYEFVRNYKIQFNRSCGKDDICRPNLALVLASTGHVTIGRPVSDFSVINVTVTMVNTAESAFSAWLHITVNRSIRFRSSTDEAQIGCRAMRRLVDTSSNPSKNALDDPVSDVVCEFSNPIIDDADSTSPLSFQMTFELDDVSEETVLAGGLSMIGLFGTHSHTSDDTRGPFVWNVPAKYSSRLNATRADDTEIKTPFSYDDDDQRRSMDEVTTIIQKFEVISEGPGSMPLVVVDVQLPFQNTSENELVVVNKVYAGLRYPCRATKSSCVRHVTGRWIHDAHRLETSSQVTQKSRREQRLADAIDEKKTPNWWGKIAGLTKRRLGHVILNAGTLMYSTNILVTPGSLEDVAPDNLTLIDGRENSVKAKRSTRIVLVRPPVSLPTWILLLSIGVGSLLLIIIIVILKKIGFFNRHREFSMAVKSADDDGGDTEVEEIGTERRKSRDPSKNEARDIDWMSSKDGYKECVGQFGARESN